MRKFCLLHLKKGNIFRSLISLLRLIGIGNKRRMCLNILRRQGACEDMVFRMIENSGVLPTLVLPSLEEAAKFALDGEHVWKYFNVADSRVPFCLTCLETYRRTAIYGMAENQSGKKCVSNFLLMFRFL